MEAARACQTGRFGENKVFISHVFRKCRELYSAAPMMEADFKQRLVQANHAGLVALARADLVQAMSSLDVAESETYYLNAVFHFVRI